MQKLKQLDARLITETFFSNIKTQMINRGNCYVWAYYAYLIFDDVKLCSLLCNGRDKYPSHAFVKVNDKFYDSEAPDGIILATDLLIHRIWKDSNDNAEREWAHYCATKKRYRKGKSISDRQKFLEKAQFDRDHYWDNWFVKEYDIDSFHKIWYDNKQYWNVFELKAQEFLYAKAKTI